MYRRKMEVEHMWDVILFIKTLLYSCDVNLFVASFTRRIFFVTHYVICNRRCALVCFLLEPPPGPASPNFLCSQIFLFLAQGLCG